MKRIILAIIGLAFSACLSAQTLTGQWERSSAQETEGVALSVEEAITFLESNVVEEEMVMSMKMADEPGVLKWKITFNGSWSLEDGVLTLDYDRKSVKFEALEKPDDFPDSFMKMFARKFESNLKKDMKKAAKLTVVELTSDQLGLLNEGKPGAEVGTYRRKQ